MTEFSTNKTGEVSAIQWNPFEMLIKDVMDFIGASDGQMAQKGIISIGKYKGELIIKTTQGDMTVMKNDYIIKLENGEFIVCKADVFKSTYGTI